MRLCSTVISMVVDIDGYRYRRSSISKVIDISPVGTMMIPRMGREGSDDFGGIGLF